MSENNTNQNIPAEGNSAPRCLFIETYGCQMNAADSEVVAAILGMAGYEMADDVADADAILLNTCSIRDNAEQKIVSRLQYLGSLRRKRHGKLIVGVIGCMAERVRDSLINDHGVDVVAGPDSYLDLPALFAAAEAGKKAINVELSTTETYRDIIPRRIGANPVSGFVSIMRGCNNFCSYCIVPYTRGRERSREVNSIIREVLDLQSRGFKEVTLLGQNVNSYSYTDEDGNTTDFATLLAMVADAVPDMLLEGAAFAEQELEVGLGNHNGSHSGGEVEVAVGHHVAVVLKFAHVGESAHYQQAYVAETHLLKVEILHHKRGEVEACHIVEQPVGAHRITREYENEQLRLIRVTLEIGRLAVGVQRSLGVGQAHVPYHAACVGESGVGLLPFLEPLQDGSGHGGHVGVGPFFEQVGEALAEFVVVPSGHV